LRIVGFVSLARWRRLALAAHHSRKISARKLEKIIILQGRRGTICRWFSGKIDKWPIFLNDKHENWFTLPAMCRMCPIGDAEIDKSQTNDYCE
jgi:hypothetical protein